MNTPKRTEYGSQPNWNADEKRVHLLALIAALRSGEFQQGLQVSRFSDGIRMITDDGKWSAGGVATEIQRRLSGRGYWEWSDGLKQFNFHEVIVGNKWSSSAYSAWGMWDGNFFGLNGGGTVVIRWLDDGTGHATPAWGTLKDYEANGATFDQIAAALERTYLLPIPTENFDGLASRKGNKDVKSGMTLIGRKMLTEVAA